MVDSAVEGAEIFINPSSSYIERAKLPRKIQLFNEATQKLGGSYLYVNARGMAGDRNYLDGGSIFS
jgi:hypothetical protein